LISIKKYLDRPEHTRSADEPATSELLAVTMHAYRSALRAIGKYAAHAFPAPGRDLEQELATLESSLSTNTAPSSVKHTQEQVESRLEHWSTVTAEHLKTQAGQVKELLIILASTADSVGERDQCYSNRFACLTTELNAIANLDDLTQIRSSLIKKAAELKSCVDQMAHDGQSSLTRLRSRVSSYETKLKAVEILASKDIVTGLANRRAVESRIEWNIEQNQTFCVVILDLNGFKQINDKHGHPAGDCLLKMFSQELQNYVRFDDIVGRWGGDEFIVVLRRDLSNAMPQIDRIRQWVFGKYSIETAAGPLKVDVAAAIGLAQWFPGQTMQQVIEQADAAMYQDKKAPARKIAPPIPPDRSFERARLQPRR
jgi:diguanylate cyclase (GGDEF)-like protein